MFDLSKIDFIKSDKEHGRKNYSFVGLQRSTATGKLEFWLPLGFDNFDSSNFDNVKGFFFKMYRTFKAYVSQRTSDSLQEQMTATRDGFIEADSGFDFVNQNNSETVFYGKLNALDKIIEGYDDLRIASLDKKDLKDNIIDYSRIHRYMHKAIYLDNDVIYLDEMNIAKNIITQEGPPILQIFSFIYIEIKKELEELDNVTERAFELSEQFKDKYLQPDSSLFSEENFADTLIHLKAALEDIDSSTVYKDADYWHFFEATEAFLYGERDENSDGVYWGISNFYDIWEDMCQTYMLNQEGTKHLLLFADIKGRLFDYGRTDINPYVLQFNNLPTTRKLKPDLVLFKGFMINNNEHLYTIRKKLIDGEVYHAVTWHNYDKMTSELPEINRIFKKYMRKNLMYKENPLHKGIRDEDLKHFEDEISSLTTSQTELVVPTYNYNLTNSTSSIAIKIIDYKYMHTIDYEEFSPYILDINKKNKIKEDIHKQLIYEWSTQQNIQNSITESEFWIPQYSSASNEFSFAINIANDFFNNSRIKLVGINFTLLQNFYIKHNTL